MNLECERDSEETDADPELQPVGLRLDERFRLC